MPTLEKFMRPSYDTNDVSANFVETYGDIKSKNREFSIVRVNARRIGGVGVMSHYFCKPL